MGKAVLKKHGNQGIRKRSNHVDETKGWIDTFISIFGEKMPDKDEVCVVL